MQSYLTLAFKVLARRKFFTSVSLFGISITLLVLIVATAMLDNFFAPRAPESRFDRVLCVYTAGEYGPQSNKTMLPGYLMLDRWMRTLPGIEASSIMSEGNISAVYSSLGRVDVETRHTDGSYWRILDFRFLEGRPYSQADDDSGARVAVVSDALARKLFGAGPYLERTFELDGDPFRIIGVVAAPSRARMAAYAEVWVPIGTLRSSGYRHEMLGDFQGLVLAKSAADRPRLQREFAARVKRMPIDDPMWFTEYRVGLDTPFDATARILTANRLGDRAPFVVRSVFVTLALLFMSLPALNLITLNLSRILERASEIGVRKAFGAPRRRLITQFLVENIVLSLIGGPLGFILAVGVLSLIEHSGFAQGMTLDVNLRVFGYGVLLSVVFGLFSGVYPAWRMSRLDPIVALRGGAR